MKDKSPWCKGCLSDLQDCNCGESEASSSSPCSLFRSTWEERDGKMEPVQTPDLFVWACVHTKTGKVEMTEIQPYDDELDENLAEGWEWRRFRLIEANDQDNRYEP